MNLTRQALQHEIWAMLPDSAKEIMLPVKDTYIESMMADIDSYCASVTKNHYMWQSTLDELPKVGEVVIVQYKTFEFEEVKFTHTKSEWFKKNVQCWLKKVTPQPCEPGIAAARELAAPKFIDN